MASSMQLFPTSRLLVDEETKAWLEEGGLVAPEDAAQSGPPTVEDLREILHELGWRFTEHLHADHWQAMEEPTDGEWPPFSDLNLIGLDRPSIDQCWGFRLGPIEGALEIARHVARRRGSQVAVEASGGGACVITWEMTNDEIVEILFAES